jgi:hypothetical protein
LYLAGHISSAIKLLSGGRFTFNEALRVRMRCLTHKPAVKCVPINALVSCTNSLCTKIDLLHGNAAARAYHARFRLRHQSFRPGSAAELMAFRVLYTVSSAVASHFNLSEMLRYLSLMVHASISRDCGTAGHPLVLSLQ